MCVKKRYMQSTKGMIWKEETEECLEIANLAFEVPSSKELTEYDKSTCYDDISIT